MATWAIGDVHGCYRSLRRLLARRAIARGDRLWFVGDLVNRGPRSLETLRYVADLGERAAVVLGNHDLHFLARAAGEAAPRKRDSLEALLGAPDLGALVSFLVSRPLLVAEGDRMLVHAGLLADWSAAAAVRRARRVERALRGAAGVSYLKAYRPGKGAGRLPPRVEREVLDDLRVLTLVRTVSREGRPRFDFTGPPRERPRGSLAWFDVPWRRTARRTTLVFGHWAALGLVLRDDVVALDTGCAWGGALTAVRLEDRRVEQTENVE
jgi:bis(5'-nucleosyl)-tetraphosphatase (symmetrical)